MKDVLNDLKERFALDKQAHFFASGWVFFVLMIVFNDYDYGIVGTVVLFTAKELYDKYVKGTGFNIGDMVFNVIGLVVALLIYDLQFTHNIFKLFQ